MNVNSIPPSIYKTYVTSLSLVAVLIQILMFVFYLVKLFVLVMLWHLSLDKYQFYYFYSIRV